MNVHKLAERVGVPDHVVRYYTQRGLLEPRRNAHNGYREFAPSDLYRLRFICRAKLVGFTLNDISRILDDADRGVTPCPQVREIIRRRAEDNERRLAAARRLQSRIRDAIELWEAMPDESPDNESLCQLIDALASVEGDDELMMEQTESVLDE